MAGVGLNFATSFIFNLIGEISSIQTSPHESVLILVQLFHQVLIFSGHLKNSVGLHQISGVGFGTTSLRANNSRSHQVVTAHSLDAV